MTATTASVLRPKYRLIQTGQFRARGDAVSACAAPTAVNVSELLKKQDKNPEYLSRYEKCEIKEENKGVE